MSTDPTDASNSTDDAPAIAVDDLSFSYRNQENLALQEVSLSVREGEFLGIVGETGAGKTTLLSTMCGVVPFNTSGDFSGEVRVRGRSVADYESIHDISSTVSMVLDNPENQLFNLHVRDEIMWGPENMGVPREEILRRTEEALELFDLEGYEDRITYTLSGGEKQKVAIASVYAMSPDIILLDEPTSQLDPIGTEMVFDAIDSLIEQGVTIVMVEHKIEELAQYADRIAHLTSGQLRAVTDTRSFFVEDRAVTPPQVTELGLRLMDDGVNHEVPLTLSEAIEEYHGLIGAENGGDCS
jgi:energy-coupling factor transporter ATP-binding protein EcfA2